MMCVVEIGKLRRVRHAVCNDVTSHDVLGRDVTSDDVLGRDVTSHRDDLCELWRQSSGLGIDGSPSNLKHNLEPSPRREPPWWCCRCGRGDTSVVASLLTYPSVSFDLFNSLFCYWSRKEPFARSWLCERDLAFS